MRFRFLGTEIYISFLFMAVITLMLAFDKTGLVLPTLVAVLLHETGHLFIMWVKGMAPKRIKLIPASVQITNSFSRCYRNDIAIALAGPAVNFLFFGVLYYNYLCYKNEGTLYFALLNLLIGGYNMLPIKGLDGGTVLYTVLCNFADINKAELVLKLISFFAGVTVILAAITLHIKGKLNLSLYIMGVYILVTGLIKK